MKFKTLFLLVALAAGLSLSAQKIGGKVKVLEDGTWLNATLLSIKNGQYFVHFANRPDNYDRLVKESDIVFVDGDDRKPLYKRDTVAVYKTIRDTVYIKNNTRNDPPNNPPGNAVNWKTGDRVEVIWSSEWYPAKITDVTNDKYKISYDGYSSLWDEWVSADKIRKR